MTLVASYNDVLRPPASWVRKMNDEFDLIRVGTNDRGELYMFGAYVIEGCRAASCSASSIIGLPIPRRSDRKRSMAVM